MITHSLSTEGSKNVNPFIFINHVGASEHDHFSFFFQNACCDHFLVCRFHLNFSCPPNLLHVQVQLLSKATIIMVIHAGLSR